MNEVQRPAAAPLQGKARTLNFVHTQTSLQKPSSCTRPDAGGGVPVGDAGALVFTGVTGSGRAARALF